MASKIELFFAEGFFFVLGFLFASHTFRIQDLRLFRRGRQYKLMCIPTAKVKPGNLISDLPDILPKSADNGLIALYFLIQFHLQLGAQWQKKVYPAAKFDEAEIFSLPYHVTHIYVVLDPFGQGAGDLAQQYFRAAIIDHHRRSFVFSAGFWMPGN